MFKQIHQPTTMYFRSASSALSSLVVEISTEVCICCPSMCTLTIDDIIMLELLKYIAWVCGSLLHQNIRTLKTLFNKFQLQHAQS